jgi:two-component system response regulator FixJ
MKRAYIVDDDEAFRKSLELLLKAHGWRVEAFDSPKTFVARAAALDPGLLLLDLHLPGESGLELLESRIAELDRFAVIMVTGAGEIQTAVRTIRAGAIDFIEKPFEAPELLERLEGLDSTLAEMFERKRQAVEARRRIATLSPRERDVLERLLSGASNKLIGRALGLSPRTVEMHRAKMLGRLGAATTAEALEIAREAGMEPLAAD